jgi:hypothetical protein
MNKFQRIESREIKFLIKNWFMAKNTPYKRVRKFMRKLKREVK